MNLMTGMDEFSAGLLAGPPVLAPVPLRQHAPRIRLFFGHQAARPASLAVLRRELIEQAGLPFDPAPALDWLVARAAYLGLRPVLAAAYDATGLSGVTLLLGRQIGKVPVGWYETPYPCGSFAYLGREQDRLKNVGAAVAALMKHPLTIGVSAVVSTGGGEPPDLLSSAPAQTQIQAELNSKGCYLPLAATAEEVFARFGQKTRRNLRYYARKAEPLGCRFVEQAAEEDAIRAVETLNAAAGRFMSRGKARLRRHLTAQHPGGFTAMLVDKIGDPLSLILGWRADGVCFIDWQINREASNQISFSTLMRRYLIESEVRRGSRGIVFLGGSNDSWENACCRHEVWAVEARRTGNTLAIGRRVAAPLIACRPLNRARGVWNALSYRLTAQA